jgi:hypothetical protein
MIGAMIRGLVFVAAFSLCAATTKAVAATATGPAFADGRRHAAYEVPGSRTRIVNTDSGHAVTVRTPEGCSTPRPSNASVPYVGTGLKAVANAQMLWQCYDRRSGYRLARYRFRIYDIRTGRTRTIIPAPGGLVDAYSVNARAFGRHWIKVEVTGYHGDYFRIFARSDGSESGFPSKSATQWDDLDARTLNQPLCRGLRRRRSSPMWTDTVPEFDAFDFNGKVGLTETSLEFRQGLLLQRCGSPVRTLARCSDGCTGPQLSTRYVSWSESNGVDLYDVATHHRVYFPTIKSNPVGTNPVASHTRHTLFISAAARLPGYLIRSVALPPQR